MFGPEDVYLAIEGIWLGSKLYLSSSYQTTERWTKESLEFKVLMSMLVGGEISEDDIYERLKILAEKEFEKQYENPNDIPIYVYLTALAALNEPYTASAQEKYLKGCEIVGEVGNLHWARHHVLFWSNYVEQESIRPVD